MIMRTEGYELALVRSQAGKRVGIFHCDESDVFSDKTTSLSKDLATESIGDLHAKHCEWGSWCNAEVFVRAWRKVVDNNQYFNHHWTVKCDPDTVFFPERLRLHLQNMPIGKKIYLKNWRRKFGFLGPIEVFSRDAVHAFGKGSETCEKKIGLDKNGEDGFMQACMELLEVHSKDDFGLLDHTGTKGSCYNQEMVAFHPFKSEGPFFECMRSSGFTGYKVPRPMASSTHVHQHRKREELNQTGFCCASALDKEDMCGTCWPGARLSHEGYCGASKARCEECHHHWCNKSESFAQVVMRKEISSGGLLREAREPPMARVASTFGSFLVIVVMITALSAILATWRRSWLLDDTSPDRGNARLLLLDEEQSGQPCLNSVPLTPRAE